MIRSRPRTRPPRWCLLALIGLASLALFPGAGRADAPAVGAQVAFVSCPVYRDTDRGRKSGCWLATDPESSVTYDVSFAPIKPQHDHAVLVEGIVTGEPDVCGGVVVKPVRVAVLPDACPIVKVPAGPYTGRPSPPPTETLRPAREPRQLPPPPYETRTFHIYFELGRDFLIYQHAEVVLEKVMLYARASHATRVDITGYAATATRIVSGKTLHEPPELADARAAMAAEALRRLNVPSELLHLHADVDPAPTDFEGLPEVSKRRVTIVVTPGPS